MKYSILAAIAVILASTATSVAQVEEITPALACKLPTAELAERKKEILQEIVGGIQSVRELDDGYEFTFPGTDEWMHRLFEFVDIERGCCSFFEFNLSFDQAQGPIRMSIHGDQGVKKLIETLNFGSASGSEK